MLCVAFRFVFFLTEVALVCVLSRQGTVAHCDASYRCACADGEQHLPLPVCCRPCSTIVYRAVHLSISYYSNTTFVEIMCGRTQYVGFAGPLCEMDVDECASVRRNSTPFVVQSLSLQLASSLSRQMITHFYVRNEILFSLTQMSTKTRLVFCTLRA